MIVRPRFIWGKGDTTLLPNITAMIKSGRFAWIGGGLHLTDITHVDNVVEGLVLAAAKGGDGETYFVTDGDPVVFREFLTELLATQGVDVPGRRYRRPSPEQSPRWRDGLEPPAAAGRAAPHPLRLLGFLAGVHDQHREGAPRTGLRARANPRGRPRRRCAPPRRASLDEGPRRAEVEDAGRPDAATPGPTDRGCGRRVRAAARSATIASRIASLPRWRRRSRRRRGQRGGMDQQHAAAGQAARAARASSSSRSKLQSHGVTGMPAPRPKNSTPSTVAASRGGPARDSQPAAASRSSPSVSLLPGTRTVGHLIARKRVDRLASPCGPRRSRRRPRRGRRRRSSRPAWRPDRGRGAGR